MSETPHMVGSIENELAEAQRLLGTDAAGAAAKAEQILLGAPGHPGATLLLGAARRFNGQLQQAIEIVEPLTRSQPDWAAAHYELGRACAAAGRRDQAIAALRRAVELQPVMTGAWCSLADELRAAGRADEADEVCARRIEMASGDPQLQQAIAALREQRFAEANNLLHQQLQRDPTDVVAMQMLAAVAMRMEHYDDAERLLQRFLQLVPNYAAAHHDYALVLDKQMRRSEALGEIERALAADPENPNYRLAQAVIFDRIGEYSRAIEIYAGLLAEKPEQPAVWASYGHALRAAGREAETIEAYKKAISLRPEFGEAWWSLADLKTYEFSSEESEQLQQQLERVGPSDADRQHLEFTVGKVLEDAGDYAGSFEHYATGNRLRREAMPYDAAQLTDGIRRSKALLTADFFAEREGHGCMAEDPIFIVGLPRAGSTLLEQILASHSAVEGTMELPDMLAIVRELNHRDAGKSEGQYPEVLASLDAGELRALGERYLASTRIYRKSDRPMFIDKMPNNFANVGLIQLILPNARIVDARRHPLATCFSIYKQLFARGQQFAYGLEDLGHTYRDYVELMAHFDAVLPGKVHRVIYERMIDDTEAEIRSLLDYCGLPFEEGCLRFHETDRAVRTASSAQVRQPINRAGLDHWQHFESWLEPLRMALGPVLEAYPDVPAFAAAAQD